MPRPNTGPRLKYLKKRDCYYIVWSEGGRSRERSTSTRDREQAEKALGEFILEQQAKNYNGPSDPDETLITIILDEYATAHENEPSAARNGYAIDALTPFWQDKMVSEVHEKSCRDYCDKRNKKGVVASTARRELVVLRSAINFAVKSKRLATGVNFWLPEEPEPLDIWLTRWEVARMVREARRKGFRARKHLPFFILLAVYTGRRREAILGLRWTNIDLVHGTIDFRRPGEAETTKRRGKIMAHRKLLGHLRRLKAKINPGEMDYVVAWGGDLIKDVKRSFAVAVKAAKLGKRVTPHTLKHTAATWMAQNGVPMFDASDFLQTSPKTLEKVYAHHDPKHHAKALKAWG